MKKPILILAVLQCCLGYSQGTVYWPEDTVVTPTGDTTCFGSVVFGPIQQSEYFDTENRLTSSTVLLSPDTVKLTFYYKSGAVKEEYYEKLSQPIDTIIDYNPEWPGIKLVRHVKYCENGNIEQDHSHGDSTYEVYDCEGNLWMSADSINDFFIPLNSFTLYDTLTGQVKETGLMKACSYNYLSCCPEGWWNFYENGALVRREFFEDGWSKKKIDYR